MYALCTEATSGSTGSGTVFTGAGTGSTAPLELLQDPLELLKAPIAMELLEALTGASRHRWSRSTFH